MSVPAILKKKWVWIATLVVIIGGVVALSVFTDDPKPLRLDEFESAVAAGKVKSATVGNKTNTVRGTLTDGTEFRTVFPPEFADEVTTTLLEADVKVEGNNEDDAAITSLLYDLVPTILVVGVFLWFVMQMQGGGRANRFGRSKARRSSGTSVTFADVAGADEAVEELTEIRDFLKDPERFRAVGARIPRGVLLHGAPGTGKTLLAKAVAGEADAPFFTISGSDFVEMFVGVGAARVRDLFKQAKEVAPAIIFVDEIDAVGRHRGAGTGGGHDEREQTLNQLLVELDGFEDRDNVILMAATNRPDILDPALLRPGRFDRQIAVDPPDLAGREAILMVHAVGKPLDADVSWNTVARRTPGFTGADLANIVNEAALLAGRRSARSITSADVTESIDRVMAGPERRNRVMSEKEKAITAFHEAGHALVGHLLPHCDPVHKVSIVARGRALGWTLSLPTEDRYTRTQAELTDRLAMFLGGRAAEALVFDEVTTGAADDIERATALARSMVTDYGMSPEIGPRHVGSADEMGLTRTGRPPTPVSDEIAETVDREVHRLVNEAQTRATALLVEHRAGLDRVATRLIEVESIDEVDLAELISGV